MHIFAFIQIKLLRPLKMQSLRLITLHYQKIVQKKFKKILQLDMIIFRLLLILPTDFLLKQKIAQKGLKHP